MKRGNQKVSWNIMKQKSCRMGSGNVIAGVIRIGEFKRTWFSDRKSVEGKTVYGSKNRRWDTVE